MTTATMPLVILGGSDRTAVRLPEAGRGLHPLLAYKGITLRFDGRPLIALLIERARAAGAFSPVYVAGPARVYANAVAGAEVVDTDSTFGGNIAAAIEHVRRACPAAPIAFLTCDITPEPETLARMMALYAETRPCDFWFPLVRAPERVRELGASAWKPTYTLVPAGATAAVRVLPGHLVVIDPEALRLPFMFRLFDVAYRHRNRSIQTRRRAMLASLLGGLLLEDLGRVVRLRVPDVTASVLGGGLPAAARLRRCVLTVPELERALRLMFVRWEHRRAHPERRVVIPLVDELSLASDIDTTEEAREHGGAVIERPDGAEPGTD